MAEITTRVNSYEDATSLIIYTSHDAHSVSVHSLIDKSIIIDIYHPNEAACITLTESEALMIIDFIVSKLTGNGK